MRKTTTKKTTDVRMDRFVDSLKMMFSLQRQFQTFVGSPPSSTPNPVEVVYQTASIISELGEILEEYQYWKPWRKNPPDYDRNKLLFEVVDLWHFVINLTLYLGFDENELFSAFLDKNKVNFERQNANY